MVVHKSYNIEVTLTRSTGYNFFRESTIIIISRKTIKKEVLI